MSRPARTTAVSQGCFPSCLSLRIFAGGGQIGVLRPPPDTGEGDVDQMVVAAQNFFKVSAVRT